MRKRKHEHDRFLGKVKQTESCWLWTGTTYRRGYGHFGRYLNDKRVMYKAHRYAYEFYKGHIPEGLLVLHTCDNPACVNPDHLFVGTHKDNSQDMLRKGRFGYPRNPNHHWLSFERAEEMRQFAKENPTMKQKDMAKHLDTSTAQLSRILNYKIWSNK